MLSGRKPEQMYLHVKEKSSRKNNRKKKEKGMVVIQKLC